MPTRNAFISRQTRTTIADQFSAGQQIEAELGITNMSSSAVSLPSAPAIVVDTPNPVAVSAEFVYNFFETAELELPPNPQSVQSIRAEKIQSIPRIVKLAWSGVNQSNLEASSPNSVLNVSISENKEKLLAENDIAVSKLFVDYSQQELDFVSNVRSILSRLNSELSALNNGDGNRGEIKPDIQTAISKLYSATPEDVNQEFISKYMSYGSSEVMVGSARLNSPTLNESLETVYENEDIGISLTLSNTAAGSILASSYCADPLSDKSASAADLIARTISFQTALGSARPRFNLSQYGIGDAIVNNIVSFEQLDGDLALPSNSPLPQIAYKSLGYVVEKRLAARGATDQPNPTLAISSPEQFFIESPSVTELYDSNVTYNQTYYYSVRSVTGFRAYVTDKTTGQNFAVVFMIASEPVRTFVQCVDIEPPSPPTDFFVSVDQVTNKPMLTWNYPVDTRRHVKYFQVFKRKNRGRFRPVQLPFELVAMYDFNDIQGGQGLVYDKVFDPVYFRFLLPGTENAMNRSAVIDLRSTNARQGGSTTSTSFIDHEYKPGDYCIYAVVAVDAHGQSSCYSNQIGISFDRQRNTIERTDISPPGAPKTYPNLLINKQVFLDTIKNEGYSQMTVILNPDFMALNNVRGDDLSLIKTKESGGEYVIKLINLDLQKDQTVKFEILDTRTVR